MDFTCEAHCFRRLNAMSFNVLWLRLLIRVTASGSNARRKMADVEPLNHIKFKVQKLLKFELALGSYSSFWFSL